MAKFEDLEDVTIENPTAGDVVKYTATGWVNGKDIGGGGPSGCDPGNTPQKDRAETITEPWTWQVDDNQCGITVETAPGVDGLEQYAQVCPSRLVTGNKFGRMQMKTFDGGNSRITAFENQLEFADAQNESVTLSELVDCCNSGSGQNRSNATDPILVNWSTMNGGVSQTFTYETSGRAQTADTSPDRDPLWTDPTLFDVFKRDQNAVAVDMPIGANAAMVVFYYGAKIGPWAGVKQTNTGYANVGYKMEITSSRDVDLTPEPGVLAGSIRLFGDILGWDDGASQIAADEPAEDRERLREQRTPSHTQTVMKAVRVDFTEGVDPASPTKLFFKPFCTVNRVRGCKVEVSIGRVMVFPYFDDGTNWEPDGFQYVC